MKIVFAMICEDPKQRLCDQSALCVFPVPREACLRLILVNITDESRCFMLCGPSHCVAVMLGVDCSNNWKEVIVSKPMLTKWTEAETIDPVWNMQLYWRYLPMAFCTATPSGPGR